MSLTPAQVAERKTGIGASEVPALLGFDPWATAADVIASKLYEVQPDQSDERAEIGSFLEPAILRLCGHRLGQEVVKPAAAYWSANGVMLANLDGQLGRVGIDAPIVEAKNSGLVDGWGDPAMGAEAVPKKVLLQVYAQFVCTKAQVAYVAALFARFGQHFAIYEVQRDEETCGLVEARVLDLHRRHIVNRDPLPMGGPAAGMDVLRRIRREPAKVVDIADDLFQEAVDAGAAEKSAKERNELARARLIASLGDAEGGRCGLGEVTYFETQRKAYSVEATSFRQCRLKPAKGAKSV